LAAPTRASNLNDRPIPGGRLTINIVSSDLPGQAMALAPRYARTVETMAIVRALVNASGR